MARTLLLSRRFNPQAYTNKVETVAPANLIAYWPLSDPVGSTVATDASGNGRNGAYSNVTLGAAGIGDGRSAATFNGTTSYCNIYSASLATAWNGGEFTLAFWFRVATAGIWVDGAVRRAMQIRVDANNLVLIAKSNSNNTLQASYVAGGTSKTVGATTSSVEWLYAAVTVSKTPDQFIFYLNGTQIGSTQTALGAWTGALDSTLCNIGATNTTPANVWSGLIAHVALWNTPLSATQIATLATV